MRAAWCRHPIDVRVHGLLDEGKFPPIANEKIEARRQTLDPMDKEHQMNRRVVGPRIPGHRAIQLLSIGTGHNSLEHVKEGSSSDGRSAVECHGAPTLPDDLSGSNAGIIRHS